MRKLTALLLCAMLVLSPAACGQKPAADDDREAAPVQTEDNSDSENAEVPSDSEDNSDSAEVPSDSEDSSEASPDSEGGSGSTETPSDGENGGIEASADSESNGGNGEIIFTEPIVAIDTPDCLFEVVGVDPNGYNGYTLEVEIANRTAGRRFIFSTEGGSIDGVPCRPRYSRPLGGGAERSDEIFYVDDDLLAALGDKDVSEITDIEVTLCVKDLTDPADGMPTVAENTIHIFPQGEDQASIQALVRLGL